ncbi:MAG: hypothetical protein NWR21_10740 [Verrucomicrobiales bacterium]|nr:hypothetical protein [Verrucomicrobiales bacterium]MDP4939778.1 hypothetical protein [Verrucomicrobiales bacterium]MDP5004776.1 hypothetical protein [Verrucomicrobiales bacterium]
MRIDLTPRRRDQSFHFLRSWKVATPAEPGGGESGGSGGSARHIGQRMTEHGSGEEGPVKHISAAGRVDELVHGKGGLMERIATPCEEPAPRSPVRDPDDLRAPLGEGVELVLAGIASGEASGIVTRHDEDIDKRQQIKVLCLESMRAAVKRDSPPTLPDDTRGIEAGGPVTTVEMENAASGEGTGRQLRCGQRHEIPFFKEEMPFPVSLPH